MNRRRVVGAGLATAASVGLSSCADNSMPASVDAGTLPAAITAIAGARLLFCHQSVGRDVLLGVESLAQGARVDIRIVEFKGLPAESGPGIFHCMIGVNGKPEGKVDAFLALLNGPEQPRFDVAILKFCFEDLNVTDVGRAKSLFDYYASAVQKLKLARPDVRVVPATIPLLADVKSWKTPVRRLIGMGAYGDAENVVRNAYNALVRARFGGEPIFDIANAESTEGADRQSGFKDGGRFMQTLSPLYTNDGAHPNDLGSQLAGAEFIRATSRALKARSSSQ